MTPTNPLSLDSAESARQRVARAEEIKKNWRNGQRPDAATILRDNPELAADPAIALDLAYEEFCTREEAGEKLDSVTFCERFDFGLSLRRLITVHRFLSSNPEVFRNSTPTVWPAIGDRVADFELKRELGRGGFARVYLATEASAGARPVALKVSAAASREADTLGPLSHPNLITVYSSRPVGSWNVVAMPFAGTATLEDVFAVVWDRTIKDQPRSAEVLLQAARRKSRSDDPACITCPPFPLEASLTFADGLLAIARGLISALVYLHGRGLAHRDLKPSNVLLSPSCHPYLLDFNLASHVSDVWAIAGTLPYLAPEQLAMLAEAGANPKPPADARPADVFAFGVMLFELLTGRHPFVEAIAALGDNQTEAATTLLAAQRKKSPSPNALSADLPPKVRDGLMRCLALASAARPTAAELEQLFMPPVPPMPRRWLRWVVVAASTLAIAAALGLGIAYYLRPAPQPQPEPTEPPPANAFEAGKILYRQGDYTLAASEFQKFGKENNNGRAHAYAAYCLSLRGQDTPALVEANQAISLGFNSAPVYANRAWNNLQLSKFPEAKADCDHALALNPNLREARLTRATLYLRLHLRGEKLSPEAVTDIDIVVAREPNTGEVWVTAMQIYAAAQKFDETIEAVRRAIRAGESPNKISRNTYLPDAIKNRPDFQDALKLKPETQDKGIKPNLVNIID